MPASQPPVFLREQPHRRPRRVRTASLALLAMLPLTGWSCGRQTGPRGDGETEPTTGSSAGAASATAAGDDAAAARGVRIAATLPPLAWLAARIGGERVTVTTLLPAGSSPHAFEPTPREIRDAGRADVLLEVDHPDLTFERRFALALASGRRDLDVVRLSQALDLGASHERGDDPHVWLSPRVMTAAAGRLAAVLARRDPPGAGSYRRNLAAFRAEVSELDAALAEQLAGPAGRPVFVDHPAWGHLLRAYGVRQEAVETAGKEPGPARLAELVELARRSGARAVFVQRGTPDRVARVLASEIGAEVVPLDPLAYDWPAGLESAAAAFRRSLPPPARQP